MSDPVRPPVHRIAPAGPSAAAIFLVLRRMRMPLILLVCIFAVSTIGLTLIPGTDADGNTWRMDPFEAFYFMSYTATTIGFGEVPYAFSTQQRAWVIVSIYLSVIGWAYAIGYVLYLLRDPGLREALSLQSFERRVRRLREPYLVIAGFGKTGEIVARALDVSSHRLVVIDIAAHRIDALDSAAFRSEVPGLVADAKDPHELRRAGLQGTHCAGVVAVTDDDQANLAVVVAAGLLRPDLPVVCRTFDSGVQLQMQAFGTPMVIDPFNLYGDGLMLAMQAPQTHRLVNWLTSGKGEELPAPLRVPGAGRWVVAGQGAFGRHLVADLHRHGLPITAIDIAGIPEDGVQVIHGDATDPEVLAGADLGNAAVFAAATGDDTTNLSLLLSARARNPDLFVIGRQNDPANGPLFEAMALDSTLIPTQLTAHEVLARINEPTLWRFVQESQTRQDSWALPLLERITAKCGTVLPDVWRCDITDSATPALMPLLGPDAMVGALLRDPEDRDRELDVVALMIKRGEEVLLTPADDEVVLPGDRLLLVGMSYARRALDTTLCVPAAAEYVITGKRVGQSWIWRTLVDR